MAASAGPTDPFEDRPGYRMRGAYLAVEDIALVEPAAQAGIDTLLVGFPKLKVPLDPVSQDQLRQWASTCQRHGIAFWVVLKYFGVFEPAWIGPYRQYVNGDGARAKHTPCPLDEDFWRRSVEQRCLELAELSRPAAGGRLSGVMLDPEMYGADIPTVFQVCYCGDCLARTLKDAGLDTPPPYPDARREWLASRGLLERHYQLARQTMQQLADRTRARVTEIAPDLLLGACAIDPGQPLAEGLLLGLGRPEKPAYAFSEATYVQGYTAYVPQAQQRMEQLGAHARMVCGVWQSKFVARVLAAQLYECARNSAGYWIYTLETFRRPDYSPLPGNATDYWAAIRRANDELGRLAVDPSYQTTLKIEPFLLPPTPLTTRGVERLALAPASPLTEQAQPPADLRGTNILYLYAVAGHRVTMPVRLIQAGSIHDGGQYLLVAPDGQVVTRRDLLEVGQPVAVEFQAEQTGWYALLLGAGDNVVRVEARQPYAIAANPKSPAHLFVSIPALYVRARPGQRQMTLQLGIQGEAERVRVVITQGEAVRYDAVVTDTRSVNVPLDPGSGSSVLKIDVQRVPGAVREDFSVAVVSGAYSFVSVAPEGLPRD